ncbi:Glucuronosyltransferase [Bertholletia excelsa]
MTMMKVLVRIYFLILAFFLSIYVILLLQPYHEHEASLFRCLLHGCHHKVEEVMEMKAAMKARQTSHPKGHKLEKPSFMNTMGKQLQIAMVNVDDEDITEWKTLGKTIRIHFDRVSDLLNWNDLFPEWIDEEKEFEAGRSCPEIPMPSFNNRRSVDVVVAKLPCRFPDEGWGRDVRRLQAHLVVANVAVKMGRKGRNGMVKVVLLSKCRPMPEIFRCDDLVRREGEWWLFEVDAGRLEQKVALPAGSCKFALPLWGKGIDKVYNVTEFESHTTAMKREAYVTILHSKETYVCGAITLAQSLLRTGTQRDLVLLLDKSISIPKHQALAAAGWKIRLIERIRNPRARPGAYNEYNYSKFRLWQLIEYDKIIFIDSDIIVLRNLDILFYLPQMSATGNNGSIFNSGIMVTEPSNCTFEFLMSRRTEIVSYNGGDQGFLNEVFVWWHRLPWRVNFPKYFWSNSSDEFNTKNQLFGSDPPKLYAIHYLGLKPWQCYRDYDCNWDLPKLRVYASDVAHRRWWKLHDVMDKSLQRLCGLSEKRKIELAWDRKKAREMGLPDEHCRMNVTDPRQSS